MLETFTCATFEPHVGERFRLQIESGSPIEAVLVDATVLRTPSQPGCRAPFSIVFCESSGTLFPQGMYRMEHPGIGGFDLFLVPIGPDGEGMRYEAVFT